MAGVPLWGAFNFKKRKGYLFGGTQKWGWGEGADPSRPPSIPTLAPLEHVRRDLLRCSVGAAG